MKRVQVDGQNLLIVSASSLSPAESLSQMERSMAMSSSLTGSKAGEREERREEKRKLRKKSDSMRKEERVDATYFIYWKRLKYKGFIPFHV